MTTTPSAASIATTIETVDEAVMKALPFISTMLNFVPGAAVAVPFMPLLGELLQTLDNAAKVVLKEIMAHLTPGMANSIALSPSAAPVVG